MATGRSSSEQSLTTELPAPTDLGASLGPYGRWGDDGIDRWDGRLLVRCLRMRSSESLVPFAARPTGDLARPALSVRWWAPAGVTPADMAAAIRATFVIEPAALAELAAADEHLSRLAGRYPGVVPVLVPHPFTALVRSISAQQVNLRWAAVIRRRLAERYGTRHSIAGEMVFSLHPEPLAEATVEELRALQLTTSKAVSVIACARAGVAGDLERERLAAISDEALIAHVTRLPGIGRWSAEWLLARTLGRPRVVAGDLGVRKAVGRLYATSGLPSEDEVRRLTAHWGAAASTAQALALHDLVAGTA